MLPAIKTDGRYNSIITSDQNTLSLTFMEHTLTYKTNGIITNTENTVSNRNGIYYVYEIKGNNKIIIRVEIE